MKKMKRLLLLVILFASHYACTQETVEKSLVTPEEYLSCCGTDIIDTTFANGDYLYVPNSFTPNEDGHNDVFQLHTNAEIRDLLALTIYTETGDTVLFDLDGRSYDLYIDAGYTFGWDGIRRGAFPNGPMGDRKLHRGAFRYELWMLIGGRTFNKEGIACAIHCGAEAGVFEGNGNCFFSSQLNGSGQLDPLLSHGEGDCFE